MNKTIVAITVAASLAAGQANAQIAAIITPNPIVTAITLGVWLYQNTERVYYIEVESEAATLDQAKNAGFRLAVEQAIGSLVASESKTENGRLTQDDIISYASGYVDKFEIVDKTTDNGMVKIKMKVWIKRSALANRLLGESKADAEVDGSRASAQLTTINHERKTSEKLLSNVLSDYPKRAFKFEIGKTGVSTDYSGRATLNVNFKLTWDKNYIESLDTVLRASAQDKNTGGCNSWNFNKNCEHAAYVNLSGTGFWSGIGGRYAYDDRVKFTQLAQRLYGTEPAVLVTVVDAENRPIIRKCNHWAELDHQTDYQLPSKFFVASPNNNTININSGMVLNGIAQVRVNSTNIENATRVDLEVIPGAQCPK